MGTGTASWLYSGKESAATSMTEGRASPNQPASLRWALTGCAADTSASTRAAPAFPPVPGLHWGFSQPCSSLGAVPGTLAAQQHRAPAPYLQQDKPLSTAPSPVLPRSSAWQAPARSLPAASSAPRPPQARATLPTQRLPRSPRARPFIAPHTSAAELGRNRAGEPCTHRGPVAPGAGNGYWFSGLQPFPFTC